MALNLREHIRTKAVKRSIEGHYGLPVDIIYSDGSEQLALKSQVLYDTEQLDPETGDLVSVGNTFLTFAQVSLEQEIADGDNVYFRFPKRPGSAEQIAAMLDGSKAIINGDSIGFIRIPVTDAEQS